MGRHSLRELKEKMEAKSPGITARVPEIIERLDAEETVRQPLALAPIRRRAGRTQAEVALALGVSQPEISQLEQREDTSVSTLQRYAAALGGELIVAVKLDDRLLSVLPAGEDQAAA